MLFMEQWVERTKGERERFIEQSALTHLLQDVDPNMFTEYAETSLSLGGETIRLKVLPCRVYNHYRARRYGVTKENKIVHFKSLNYRKEVFYDFLQELGIPLPDAVQAVKSGDF